MAQIKSSDYRIAQKGDEKGIFEIADELSLRNSTENSKVGFLDSDFSQEDYLDFIESSKGSRDGTHNVIIIVALDGVDIVGFLLAYDYIFLRRKRPDLLRDDTTERRIFERFDGEINFFIVKQVARKLNSAKRGIGKGLYRAFLEKVLTLRNTGKFRRENQVYRGLGGVPESSFGSEYLDIFTAVLDKPENSISRSFHEDLGFLPLLQWSNRELFSEGHRVRTILHVGSPELSSALARKGRAAAPRDERERLLKQALDYSSHLYTHEDRLNWRKLTYATHHVVAIMVAQFSVFYSETDILDGERVTGVVVIFVLGSASALLTLASMTSIKSGIDFMKAHKRSVRLTEMKAANLISGFHPSVLSVPTLSNTVRVMLILRYVLLAVSISYTGGLIGLLLL